MEVKRINMDGREFAFICDWRGTRNGFAHDATMMENWRTVAKATRHYINRTWECWSYQSAILDAIKEAMDEEAKWIERKVKRENGWEKLTAKRREAVDAALAESEDYAIYKKLYDECKGYYPAWVS